MRLDEAVANLVAAIRRRANEPPFRLTVTVEPEWLSRTTQTEQLLMRFGDESLGSPVPEGSVAVRLSGRGDTICLLCPCRALDQTTVQGAVTLAARTRSFLTGPAAADLYLFLIVGEIAPEQASLPTWIEADDQFCRRFVFVAADTTADECLDRTFLASPWHDAGAGPSAHLTPMDTVFDGVVGAGRLTEAAATRWRDTLARSRGGSRELAALLIQESGD